MRRRQVARRLVKPEEVARGHEVAVARLHDRSAGKADRTLAALALAPLLRVVERKRDPRQLVHLHGSGKAAHKRKRRLVEVRLCEALHRSVVAALPVVYPVELRRLVETRQEPVDVVPATRIRQDLRPRTRRVGAVVRVPVLEFEYVPEAAHVPLRHVKRPLPPHEGEIWVLRVHAARLGIRPDGDEVRVVLDERVDAVHRTLLRLPVDVYVVPKRTYRVAVRALQRLEVALHGAIAGVRPLFAARPPRAGEPEAPLADEYRGDVPLQAVVADDRNLRTGDHAKKPLQLRRRLLRRLVAQLLVPVRSARHDDPAGGLAAFRDAERRGEAVALLRTEVLRAVGAVGAEVPPEPCPFLALRHGIRVVAHEQLEVRDVDRVLLSGLPRLDAQRNGDSVGDVRHARDVLLAHHPHVRRERVEQQLVDEPLNVDGRLVDGLSERAARRIRHAPERAHLHAAALAHAAAHH